MESVGCVNERCNFIHPDDPDWLHASLTFPPKASFYKDGVVPRTPTPPSKRLATPDHSREPRVKEEQKSPLLSNFFDTAPAKIAPVHDRRSSFSKGDKHSRSRSAAGSRGLSPSRDREAGRDRDRDRDKDRDRRHDYEYGDKGKEWGVRDHERDRYGELRDRDRDRGREYERDRGWGYDHGRAWMDYAPPDERSSRDRRPIMSTDRSQDIWKTLSSPGVSRASIPANERARTTSGDLSAFFADRDRDRDPDTPMSAVSGGAMFGADRAPTATPSIPQPVASSSSCSSFSNNGGLPHPPDSAMSSVSFASSSMPPPPMPTSSASASFVVPPLPSCLTTQQAAEPVKKELLSLEQRREIWDKRIELLAEAISARQTYGELVDNVKVLQSLIRSARYVQSTPAVRESIDTSLRNVEKQRDDARRRAEAITSRIYEMDFWPMRRRTAGNDAEGAREDAALLREDEHEEMKTMVNDLNDAVNRLDRQTKEVISYVRSRTRSKPAPASTTAHADMEWNPQNDGVRGSKRRKVGDEGAYTSDSGSTVVGRATPTPAPLTSDSLDALSAARLARRVERLEAMYADIENMSTQTENAQTEEIGALIDTHLDRLRGNLEQQLQISQQVRISKLEVEVDQSGNDVVELATTVADLVESTGKFRDKKVEYEAERERIAQEHAALRSAMERSRTQTEAIQAQIRANIAETAALREALKHMHRPAPAPHVPSVDELAAALLPRILDAVRDDVATRMAGARAEITAIVRASLPPVDSIREKVEKVRDLPEALALIDGLPSSTTAAASTVENGVKKLQQANGHGHTIKPPT
ncbi:hypothetical protein EW145_g1503 [Phellinidium pouzarii]|uniref:Uncharacterized protein n=1 Tax=Phellinidium pouzarii TaxID=167371 RepID=A0A4S4LJV4_9AGAM|nr:hypothetical protein EW145_g1503 [Phellinidium pouzarii]